MNRIFLLVLALLIVSVPAMSEAVDAVYFNPSRLGRYEYLKVSDKLTANGGITATNMSVQNQQTGIVTINNTGTYTIQNIEAAGSVQMPDTTFTTNSISALPGSRSSFDKDSVIDNLLTLSFIKAHTLTALGKIQVTGNSSGKDLDGNRVTGLKIGNDIPVPTGCSNGLAFVERKDSNNKTYKVLGCLGEAQANRTWQYMSCYCTGWCDMGGWYGCIENAITSAVPCPASPAGKSCSGYSQGTICAIHDSGTEDPSSNDECRLYGYCYEWDAYNYYKCQ